MKQFLVPPSRAEGYVPVARETEIRPRWRVLASGMVAVAAFFALAMALSAGLGLFDVAEWAASQQRAFHEMVRKLLSADTGGVLAMATLLGACLAYGFVHAAIPGHGKFLIAGAGLASRVSASKLVGLTLAASFCQALVAIALVYGGFALLDITAGWAMTATDRVLIPLSYVAIGVIALILMRRGVRGLEALWEPANRAGHASPADHGVHTHVEGAHSGHTHHGHTHDRQTHNHDTHDHHTHDHHTHHHHTDDHSCGCGHKHGPSVEEVAALRSWRDAVALVISIGLRPCTGAVFVLVAAWRLNLEWLGAAGAFAMAMGTGAFISIVAVSAVGARGATLMTAGARGARVVAPLIQLVAGGCIFVVAAAFLVASLTVF